MKAHDFIRSAIGKPVILFGVIDAPMCRFPARAMMERPSTLVELTKGGEAVVEFEGQRHKVAPRYVRLYVEGKGAV